MAVTSYDPNDRHRPRRIHRRRMHPADVQDDVQDDDREEDLPPVLDVRGARRRVPRIYGAVACALGAAFWPLGAWYTASGWAWLLSYLLHKIGLPWTIPQPSGLAGLGVAILIGVAYTTVELSPPDLRALGAGAWLLTMAIWLVVILSDVGTTFTGSVQPAQPGELPILIWMAQHWAAAAVWSVLLTFGPDQVMLRGWRVMRGQAPFARKG